MSSKFKTAILHTVVGTPEDFRPRAPFVPEICLYEDSGPSLFVDLLLPVSQWGGWPAVLQETLQETRKSQAHLVGGIPFNALSTNPEERCSEFLTSIKRLLITARKNLMARGVEEIRTGTLISTLECLDWYVHQAGSGALNYLARLKALGFASYLCVVDERDESKVQPPFQAVSRPDPSTTKAQAWAACLVEKGVFPDGV